MVCLYVYLLAGWYVECAIIFIGHSTFQPPKRYMKICCCIFVCVYMCVCVCVCVCSVVCICMCFMYICIYLYIYIYILQGLTYQQQTKRQMPGTATVWCWQDPEPSRAAAERRAGRKGPPRGRRAPVGQTAQEDRWPRLLPKNRCCVISPYTLTRR